MTDINKTEEINKERRTLLTKMAEGFAVFMAWLCAPSLLNAGNVSFKSKNQSSSTLFMTDNSKVGIGTNSPSEKLEVVGNIKASGSINTESGKISEGGNSLVPAGSIQMYGGSTAPGGWLMCDGSAVSRTTYASLYAAIGTTYGAGDGSTTFNLPDFRGIFPRGAGTSGKLTNANGVFFNATIGSYQNDKMQGHKHSPNPSYGASSPGGYNLSFARGSGYEWPLEMSTPITDGSNGIPRTGAETNPANLAVNFIIKY